LKTDHGRLKHCPQPMRGLRSDHIASIVIAGTALLRNLALPTIECDSANWRGPMKLQMAV
jgi:hypothetical protein